jgi:SAM-dependent methyltransferase
MKPNDMPASAAHAADTDRAWAALHSAASQPYRATSRWAYHWARGKLRHDPVFRGMLTRGDLPANARVVDIGCGQGLVASLLQACADLQHAGGWPAAWPVAASASTYTGVELMPKDVARADAALRGLALRPSFVCADMCKASVPACDVVVILDVLHYVDHAAQDAVLQRVRGALAPAGRLLLRVGDADHTRGFAWSQWVDRTVTWARGHRVPPTFGRPLKDWNAALQALDFTVRAVPQSQGTPFANVLLVADLKGSPP